MRMRYPFHYTKYPLKVDLNRGKKQRRYILDFIVRHIDLKFSPPVDVYFRLGSGL